MKQTGNYNLRKNDTNNEKEILRKMGLKFHPFGVNVYPFGVER